MKTQEFSIEGMSCHHCTMAVKRELAKIPNLVVEDVQTGKARVQFDETNVKVEQILHAVEEAGYKVVV